MQLNSDIKTSLQRELSLCSNAMEFYKKAVKEFEKRYNLSTSVFLKKFDAGKIGDDADYFEWYSFAKLLEQWRKTRSSIRSAIH